MYFLLKKKNPLLFVLFVLIYCISCGVVRYKYTKKDNLVVSKRRISITRIEIMSYPEGKILAVFKRNIEKDDHKMSKFNLKNFSPEYFKCIEGCNFYFETNKCYQINLSPCGDVLYSGITVKMNLDSSLIDVSKMWRRRMCLLVDAKP